jgi:hypothetical protein
MVAGQDTARQSSGTGRTDDGSTQHTSTPTVSSRDKGKGSKNNKRNDREGSSNTMLHAMRNGDAMLAVNGTSSGGNGFDGSGGK